MFLYVGAGQKGFSTAAAMLPSFPFPQCLPLPPLWLFWLPQPSKLNRQKIVYNFVSSDFSIRCLASLTALKDSRWKAKSAAYVFTPPATLYTTCLPPSSLLLLTLYYFLFSSFVALRKPRTTSLHKGWLPKQRAAQYEGKGRRRDSGWGCRLRDAICPFQYKMEAAFAHSEYVCVCVWFGGVSSEFCYCFCAAQSLALKFRTLLKRLINFWFHYGTYRRGRILNIYKS